MALGLLRLLARFFFLVRAVNECTCIFFHYEVFHRFVGTLLAFHAYPLRRNLPFL